MKGRGVGENENFLQIPILIWEDITKDLLLSRDYHPVNKTFPKLMVTWKFPDNLRIFDST